MTAAVHTERLLQKLGKLPQHSVSPDKAVLHIVEFQPLEIQIQQHGLTALFLHLFFPGGGQVKKVAHLRHTGQLIILVCSHIVQSGCVCLVHSSPQCSYAADPFRSISV